MFRRSFLASVGVTALLVACSADQATQFAQAKAYLDTGVAALLASGQAYLAGPPMPSAQDAASAKAVMDALTAAKTAIDGVTDLSSWKVLANQVLMQMQALAPMVGSFLGAAAPYIPLAIAVVQAFINSLPPPPAAPATPPAALVHQAAKYHRR